MIIWPPIVFAYLCLFVLGFMDNIRGPYFLDMILDLELSDAHASLIFGVPSILSILGSLGANRLLRYIAPMNGLRLGLFILAMGMGLSSFSIGIVSLLLPLGLFGVGLGMILVFEHVCIDQGVTRATRRRFLAGLHSMYALAALLSPQLVSYMHHEWSWRQAFSALSIFAFGVLVVTFLKKAIPYQLIQGGTLPKMKVGTRLRMYYISIIIGLYAAAELTLSSRVVLYLGRQFGFTRQEAVEYLFYFFALLFVSRLFYVVFSSPKVRSKVMLYICYTAAAISYTLGLYYHPIWLVLTGLFMGPCFAEGMDYISESFPRYSARAMAVSIVFLNAMVMIMHYIIGWLSDYESVAFALFVGPLSLLVAIILLMFQSKFRRLVDSW